jgi:hypothetical protein
VSGRVGEDLHHRRQLSIGKGRQGAAMAHTHRVHMRLADAPAEHRTSAIDEDRAERP